MAIIRKKDIKNMSAEDLKSRLADLKLELMRANVKRATKTAGNLKIKEIKKTIARILTELKIKSNTKVKK